MTYQGHASKPKIISFLLFRSFSLSKKKCLSSFFSQCLSPPREFLPKKVKRGIKKYFTTTGEEEDAKKIETLGQRKKLEYLFSFCNLEEGKNGSLRCSLCL